MRAQKQPLLTLLSTLALVVLAGCAERSARALQPVSLVAGVGEAVVEAEAGVPCSGTDENARQQAVHAALVEAVRRAATAYGDGSVPATVDEVVVQHRVDRYWTQSGQCFASVQAVVRTSTLQRSADRRCFSLPRPPR